MSARARIRQALAAGGLSSLALVAAALASEPAKAPSLGDLAWLSGSWSTSTESTRIEEHWTRPAENALLGMGRTLKDGKMVFFEYLRIEARADGIYYVAHPKARAGTDFKLTKLDDKQAVFENPQHDFPKRIVYRRESDGSITAVTDAGGLDAKEPSQEFRYRKLVEPVAKP